MNQYKISVLTLFSVLLSVTSFAQITLEPEDLPSLGDIIQFTEVEYEDLEEGPAGEDIFWDFTGLTTIQQTDLVYDQLSNYPEASQYADCESVFNSSVYDLVGIDMETVSPGLGDPDGQAFINDEYNGHLYIEGMVTGVEAPGSPWAYVNADLDNPIIHLTHLDYGQMADAVSVAYVPVSFNGINGVAELTVVRSVEADAWGTVQTPYGIFEVIRHKEITEAWAKAGIMIGGNFSEVNGVVPDTTAYQETFHYMSKEMHHPVLTVRKSLVPIRVQYVGYASGANFQHATGVEDIIEFKPTSVYPNPATDFLYLEQSETIRSISLIDIQGREHHIESNPDKNILISDLEPGLYFIKILTHSGELHSAQFIKE